MIKKQALLILSVLALCFTLSACAEKRKEAQEMLQAASEKDRHDMTSFAMDTVIQLTVYSEDGESLLTESEQEIRRLERLFSVTDENSEIAALNTEAGKRIVSLSEDTYKIIERSKSLYNETKGAFNITVSPIVRAWGFTTEGEKAVPPDDTIEALLPLTDINELVLDKTSSTAMLMREGMAVDLGGIAKGYTSDAVTALLREKGVESALIYLGGNISALGAKPDGMPWRVAIENPLDAEDYIGVLEVRDRSVITSGGYQRYFEENGKRYHHIIDTKTGYPAENGLISVTIVSDDGAKADAYSTALFVLGLDEALELWRGSDDFEAVFVTEDGRVVATEGADEIFTFEGGDNDFKYETVQR